MTETEHQERTVHATIVPIHCDHAHVVRYDRGGKWFYESGRKRRPLSLAAAVELVAVDRPAIFRHEGRPGGRVFDARVRKARAAAQRGARRWCASWRPATSATRRCASGQRAHQRQELAERLIAEQE